MMVGTGKTVKEFPLLGVERKANYRPLKTTS
jgi:hypothetical protein